jgi:hypothetical protein
MTDFKDQIRDLEPAQSVTLDLGDAGQLKVKTSSNENFGNGFLLATEFDEDHPLPGIHTLLHAFGLNVGDDVIAQLPTWMQSAPDLVLRSFTASIEESTLVYVAAEIGTSSSWTLIENFLVLENLAIDLQAVSPLEPDSAQFALMVCGRTRLGNALLDIGVRLTNPEKLTSTSQPQSKQELREQFSSSELGIDDEAELEELVNKLWEFSSEDPVAESNLEFFIHGSLVDPIVLADFFSHFGWQSGILFKDIEIAQLELQYDTRERAYRFFIDITHALSVSVFGTSIELKEVSLLIEGDAGADSYIGGELAATIKFAETPVSVLAKCPGASEGWVFEGRVEHLEVGDLVNELADRFSVQLPAFIRSFTIDLLDLSFETDTGDFTFTCDGQFKAGGKSIEAQLIINLSHEEDRIRSAFKGYLTVEIDEETSLYFDLDVDHDDDATTLLGAYRASGDAGKLNVNTLLSSLSDSDFSQLPKLELSVPEIYFIHRSSKDPDKELTVFGFDLEGGLDLSDIKLPSLPLLGNSAPTGDREGLRLGFKAIFSDKDLPIDNDLVALATEHQLHLPKGDVSAPGTISAVLHVGAENYPLSLPIESEIGSLQNGGVQHSTDDSNADPISNTSTSASQPKWLNIHKSLGPIHLERVGITLQDGQIQGLLDASFATSGLTISLDGLTVSSPLSPIKPSFSLHGLGIDYKNDQFEIGGAFLQRQLTYKDKEYQSYAGEVILHAKLLTLAASGMYVEINQHPSLFLYAVLEFPLGGPAFFFVTGLAASFGYNRSLKIPAIEDVAAFPLITEATAGASPNEGKKASRDPMAALNKMEEYIPPAVDEYFIGVGVRFSSFKMVDSFALLIARMGAEFEIDLLGLSTMILPPPEAHSPTILAEAQLAIKATFIPDQGVLTVKALLTPESYVFSRDCRLSGGFAFCTWFKDQGAELNDAKEGDFVITLGGYHPDYLVPAHYPSVPRLQLQWQVNDHLTIKGSAYYAITANALMAGGSLSAVWDSGDVRAWFTAVADFILAWQPNHYDARVRVNLGAEVTIQFFGTHHLSFDASAQVHLWGPEFAGNADIDLKVISFDVSFHVAFGDQAVLPEAIKWEAFKRTFLPDQLCGIGIQKGLLRSIKDPSAEEGAPDRWIVDPAQLVINIDSYVPLTHAGESLLAITPIAIAPMAIEADMFENQLSVKVTDEKGDDVTEWFAFQKITKRQPAALWGRCNVRELHGKRYVDPPAVNGEALIADALCGLQLVIKDKVACSDPLSHPLGDNPEHVENAFSWHTVSIEEYEDMSSGAASSEARNDLLHSLGFTSIANNESAVKIFCTESRD